MADAHASKYNTVRRQIMAKLPEDMNTSWRHYIYHEHLQGVGYIASLCLCYYQQQKWYQSPPTFKLKLSTNGRTINVGQLVPCLLSPIIGWAITGIVILGHDAFHKTFAPNKTFLGRIANQVASAVFIHWFGVSTLEFNDDHEFHHKYVNSRGDGQMISLNHRLSTFGEMLHVSYLVAKWWFLDLFQCVNVFNAFSPDKNKRISLLFRLNIALSLVCRALLFGGGYVSVSTSNRDRTLSVYQGAGSGIHVLFRPLIGIANSLCTAYAFNYCFFVHHVSPKPTTPEERNDHFLYTLRNTADLFPGNTYYDAAQQFLHCGTTKHASHHCMGIIPRSLTYIAAKELKAAYPEEYREVNSIAEALYWNWNKITFGFASELPPF